MHTSVENDLNLKFLNVAGSDVCAVSGKVSPLAHQAAGQRTVLSPTVSCTYPVNAEQGVSSAGAFYQPSRKGSQECAPLTWVVASAGVQLTAETD